jgi:hypothetical protein
VSVQARRLALLVRPTVRSTDWLPPVAGSLLAVAVATLARGTSPALRLELASVALGIGGSFALDDAAATSLEASPAPLALRNAVRAGCAIPFPAAIWITILLLTPEADRSTLTLELAGLLAAALALSALGMRLGVDGGLLAAPAVLGLVAASSLVHWDDFWGVGFGAAVVLGIGASRDPAHQRAAARRDDFCVATEPRSTKPPT